MLKTIKLFLYEKFKKFRGNIDSINYEDIDSYNL